MPYIKRKYNPAIKNDKFKKLQTPDEFNKPYLESRFSNLPEFKSNYRGYSADEEEKRAREQRSIHFNDTPDMFARVTSDNSDLTQSLQQYKDMPNMFIDGKINPAYDSSAFQDALAGMAIGVQSVRDNNPFATIGASIGGLLGGLVTKNVKGRMDYNRDVEDTIKFNQGVEIKTQAMIRAEQLKLAKQAEDRKKENADKALAIKKYALDIKDKQKRAEYLYKMAKTATTDEERQTISQLLSEEGFYYNPDNKGERKVMQVGDYYFTVTKGGEIDPIITADGSPVANISTKTYLEIKKKFEELKDISDTEWTSAIQTAKSFIEQNNLKFQNEGQKSAAILKFARDIALKRPTTTYTINGTTYELPLLTKPVSGSPQNTPAQNTTTQTGQPAPPFAPKNNEVGTNTNTNNNNNNNISSADEKGYYSSLNPDTPEYKPLVNAFMNVFDPKTKYSSKAESIEAVRLRNQFDDLMNNPNFQDKDTASFVMSYKGSKYKFYIQKQGDRPVIFHIAKVN
ncbi:MAG: hypothetical protein AB1695_14520 [Stygiobacter sp.]